MNEHLRLPRQPVEPPAWAGGYGADRHGVFADLVLGAVTHRLRWIEPGGFRMGSPDGEEGRWDDERPLHEVRIEQGFWLGESPVTQAAYRAVTGSDPSHFTDPPRETETRPVEQVSWLDAKDFCAKLAGMLPGDCADSARLPTEAEWEYACRAGTTAALYSGRELASARGRCRNLDELAWYDENAEETTHPVGEKAANDWGLHDLLGNVWEWCEDEWHDGYAGAPGDGRAWVESSDRAGESRVLRGGGWGNSARLCRCACRDWFEPDDRSLLVGFRLVLAPSPAEDPGHSPG